MYGSLCGRVDADEDMPDHTQTEEDRAVGQRDVRQLVLALDEHSGKPRREQQRGRQQSEQLSVARSHFTSCPSSSALISFVASD